MQYTVDVYFIQEHKDKGVTVHRVYKSPAYTGDSAENERWAMVFAQLYWHIKEWNMDEMAVTLECEFIDELMDDECEQSYRRYEYKVPIGVPVN